MNHAVINAVDAALAEDCRLSIGFDDGTVQRMDLQGLRIMFSHDRRAPAPYRPFCR